MLCHFEMPRWRRCRSCQGAQCSAWRRAVRTREDSPLAAACSCATPIACWGACIDEDSTQVGPVIDLFVRQVFEPRARSVTEVERQVLDDEEVVGCSTGVACKPAVLEPYAGVGVPIVSWHLGHSPEA
jgi:hypothetical protein